MAFMPQFAPVVVLMFLGTCGALGLTGVVALYGFLRRKPSIWKWAIVCAVVLVAGYAGLLLVASLASSERVLAHGEKKYFCEIDCHIAYSVEGVGTASALGAEMRTSPAQTRQNLPAPKPSQSSQSSQSSQTAVAQNSRASVVQDPSGKAPAAKFVIVRVRTLFDENTISPHRGNGPLTPNPRRVILLDERGRGFLPLPPGLARLATADGEQKPEAALSAPLRPGESYITDLVFDTPADVRNARLLITDQEPMMRMIIGHESSPLHKKIWFALGSPL